MQEPITSIIGAATTGGVAAEGAVAGVGKAAAESLSQAVVRAPNIGAARTVSNLAETATGLPDQLAGEKAIRGLTELPDALGTQGERGLLNQSKEPSVSLTAWQEATVNTQVQEKLAIRDAETHRRPDQATDPKSYEQWARDRWEAEIQLIVDTRVDLVMQNWQAKNQEPDKAKESDKHKQWEQDKLEYEKKAREQTNKETREAKANEITRVLEEIKRLQELYLQRKELKDGIDTIRKIPDNQRSDQDKIRLADYNVTLIKINDDIKKLEEDLRLQANRAPLLALIILPALTFGAMIKVAGQQEGIL